jgi:hypothetical protein
MEKTKHRYAWIILGIMSFIGILVVWTPPVGEVGAIVATLLIWGVGWENLTADEAKPSSHSPNEVSPEDAKKR